MELITLTNGTRLVLCKMPHVRSVAFGVWVKNGSRNEQSENNGISHFIEHMLFKGTKNRTARDIADEIDAVGGQINAYTSKEYTCYHTRTLDTHLDVAFEVLSDMFFNSNFDEAEIKKECNVISEEISMYEDTPDELAHDLLQYSVWQGSSLGYPILGTKNSISTLDQRTFMQYFSENYRPENTVISVAGNFDKSCVLDYSERFFGGYHASKNEPGTRQNAVYTPCVAVKEKDIEQVHLLFGFPGMAVGSERAYVLAVLNTVLGGSMSSRLFQKVREEHGLAYSVYSYNSSYTDTGMFTVYAALNPSRTRELISMVINELKNFSITQSELDRTKEQIKSNYVMGLESSNNMMSAIGKSQLLLRRMQTPDEIIARINKVCLSDVEDLKRDIFDFERISLSAVGNIEETELRKMLESAG